MLQFLRKFCPIDTEMTASSVSRWRVAVVAGLLGLGLVGCGGSGKGPTGTVSGQVTLNEQPLTSGYIVLTSPKQGNAAGSKLDGKGGFNLTDPLPIGDYVVTVTPPPVETSPLTTPAGAASPKSNIPEKYRTEAKSDLKFTVKAGANTAKFDLK